MGILDFVLIKKIMLHSHVTVFFKKQVKSVDQYETGAFLWFLKCNFNYIAQPNERQFVILCKIVRLALQIVGPNELLTRRWFGANSLPLQINVKKGYKCLFLIFYFSFLHLLCSHFLFFPCPARPTQHQIASI